jgi:hypothetical protein
MQQISYMIVVFTLFLFLTACGLVTFSPEQEVNKNQQATQQSQSSKEKVISVSSDKPTNSKQVHPNLRVSGKTQEKVITVNKNNNQAAKIPTKVIIPVIVLQPPKDNPIIKPPEPPNEVPPKEDEETPLPDDKYQAALKKAKELQNTDQQVTADQGNVYQEPAEKSSILLQVIKDQKLHITDTKVDKDDAEIWCYVSGNDGQKDIVGWVSYPIFEQK